MAVHIDLKVEGMEDVLKALRKAADKDLRDAVFDVGKKVIKEVRDDAKAACPVDTGNLRDAIRSSNSKKKLTFSAYVSDKKAYYAPFVEFEHRTRDGKTIAGTEFMTKSGRKHEKEFQDEMMAALEKVAKKVTE